MSPFYDTYTPRPTARVYQLRREGNIDQAYQCALALFNSNPTDEDFRKAYAWTLIDLCKRDHAAGNRPAADAWFAELSGLDLSDLYDDFSVTIKNQIRSLRMKLNPYSDKIRQASEFSKDGRNNEAYGIMADLDHAGHLPIDSHESYGWIIYRYLKDYSHSMSSVQVRTLLRDYMKLSNERPSNLHSQILNFALNYSRTDHSFRLISFLELWGPQNLTSRDYSDSVAQDGKRISSLMSRISREVIKYPQEEIDRFIDLLPTKKDIFINMLRESCFWNIFNVVGERRYNDAWSLFDNYVTGYSHFGPSEFHSRILGLAERTMNETNQYRFYGFFKKWNPSNLRDEDWREVKGENGDTYKPLAIKAIKKASDALNGLDIDASEDLTWLIDAYTDAVTRYPEDEWTIRSRATLLYRAGRVSEACDSYRDLILKLGDKYYVWSEFAACVSDMNVKTGMLCKAVFMERNEDFIGQIRLDLAEQLIALGKMGNAAYEIKRHKDHYQSKGWSIKPRVYNLETSCGKVAAASDNKALYDEFIPYAEEYAYSDIPFADFVLVDEWVNDDNRKFQKYVGYDKTEIVVNANRFRQLRKSKKGQVWSFKLYNSHSDKSVPLLVKRSQSHDWSVLPLRYGYVNHVNVEKKVYHIITQDSLLVYEPFGHKRFSKGDFVSFRLYDRLVNGKRKANVYSMETCDKDLAISSFRSKVVAVDGVNEEKRLFHFVMGPMQPSGVIRYDQTELRPEVGDCLRIYYYIREKKVSQRTWEDKRIVEVLKVEDTDETDRNTIRQFSGYLEVKYHDNGNYQDKPDFAFVGNYYVHKSVLEHAGITHDCHVKGKAVLCGDGKWKVFQLYGID